MFADYTTEHAGADQGVLTPFKASQFFIHSRSLEKNRVGWPNAHAFRLVRHSGDSSVDGCIITGSLFECSRLAVASYVSEPACSGGMLACY